jgi:hypothetical protein
MILFGKISAAWRLVRKLLLRIPFREVWLSVTLLLLVRENYPFSNFPIYFSLEDESVYFIVENGRGEMLPYVTNFRSHRRMFRRRSRRNVGLRARAWVRKLR